MGYQKLTLHAAIPLRAISVIQS